MALYVQNNGLVKSVKGIHVIGPGGLLQSAKAAHLMTGGVLTKVWSGVAEPVTLTGLKPTNHTVYDYRDGTLTNARLLYDDSIISDGSAYMPLGGPGPIIDLKGWKFSALPDDATITGITAVFRMRSSSAKRTAGIRIYTLNSHSPLYYTGVQTKSTTYQTLSVDFPVDWLSVITPAALKKSGSYFAVEFVIGEDSPGSVYFSDFFLNITYQ